MCQLEEMFSDKTILITGGTGFLGRSLIKYFLTQNVHSIRVFSRDEVKHYYVQQTFHSNKLRFMIGDVRDFERLKKAMLGVDIVIHAAALKRIDMLEYNVEEVIKTDIIGSMNVAKAALECGVEKAIMVSTDKACYPITTYGACKFVAERIFIESNYNKGKSKTIFSVVRYGNVLNSTGSIMPLFSEKIKNNEELTITDYKMTRFMITDTQAVQLITKAIKYAIGGEIFIPKLNAFLIGDLVDILIDKYKGDKNKIKIIGIRVNEKYHELMINEHEISNTFDFQDMYVIASPLIKKYQAGVDNAIYFCNGKKLLSTFKEYCSKDAVIKKEDVKKFLMEAGII